MIHIFPPKASVQPNEATKIMDFGTVFRFQCVTCTKMIEYFMNEWKKDKLVARPFVGRTTIAWAT